MWDLCATGLSSLCIFHCIGLPFIATLLPFAAVISENELVHLGLVMLAAPITLWVVLNTGFTGSNVLFALTALTGLSLLVAAVSIHSLEPFETVLTLSGGTLLGAAHLWRWLQQHGARSTQNRLS